MCAAQHSYTAVPPGQACVSLAPSSILNPRPILLPNRLVAFLEPVNRIDRILCPLLLVLCYVLVRSLNHTSTTTTTQTFLYVNDQVYTIGREDDTTKRPLGAASHWPQLSSYRHLGVAEVSSTISPCSAFTVTDHCNASKPTIQHPGDDTPLLRNNILSSVP